MTAPETAAPDQQRPSVWMRVWRVVRILLIAYLGVLLLLRLFENSLVYPAPQYPLGDWAGGDKRFETVEFHSEDGVKLNGWYAANSSPRGYLLYCHGNGSNIAALQDVAAYLRDEYDLAVFIFDYRGYGRSEGSPSEEGLLADGRAARDWLAKRGGVEPDELIIMGRSLGSAVAVDLAAEKGARGLILENGFTSLPAVAASKYPWAPVQLLMKNRLNSGRKIVNYKGPLLQSHCKEDELIPMRFGKELYEAAPGPKGEFLVFPNAGHNDAPPSEYYDRHLPLFLEKALKPS